MLQTSKKTQTLNLVPSIESQVMRTGLGGGSPQAAFGARVWCNAVGLVAPAGQDLQQVRQLVVKCLGFRV